LRALLHPGEYGNGQRIISVTSANVPSPLSAVCNYFPTIILRGRCSAPPRLVAVYPFQQWTISTRVGAAFTSAVPTIPAHVKKAL
jgi:hypothetical protein